MFWHKNIEEVINTLEEEFEILTDNGNYTSLAEAIDIAIKSLKGELNDKKL